MRFHDVEQNSDEWLALRAGKVTGSGVATIMANEGRAFGDPAKRYAVQVALERVTGKPLGGGYSNHHMDRGHEQEPVARMLYEDAFFADVANGGFFDCGKTGSSPDGLVGEHGTIEIKSVVAHVQYETIKRNNIDPKYAWQCAFNLKRTGRMWLDYISFCSDFPAGSRLFVKRIHRHSCRDVFRRIDRRIKGFERMVADITKTIEGKK